MITKMCKLWFENIVCANQKCNFVNIYCSRIQSKRCVKFSGPLLFLIFRVTSIDCGDEVSDWLSEVLGRPGTRLIRQNPDNVRTSKLKQSGKFCYFIVQDALCESDIFCEIFS